MRLIQRLHDRIAWWIAWWMPVPEWALRPRRSGRTQGAPVLHPFFIAKAIARSTRPSRTMALLRLVPVLVVLLVGGLGTSAHAAVAQVAACETIANSLARDWESTNNLFRVYGPSREINLIIRVVGPDLYFGALLLWTSRRCQETATWRWVALATWAVQTWAVNTHVTLGTMSGQGPPLLVLTVRM